MGQYAQIQQQKAIGQLDLKGLAPADALSVYNPAKVQLDQKKEDKPEFIRVKDQRPEAGKIHNFSGYYHAEILKRIAYAALESGVPPETALAVAINESAETISARSVNQGKKLKAYFQDMLADDGLHMNAFMMRPTTAYGTDTGKAFVKKDEQLRKVASDSEEAQAAFLKHSTEGFRELQRRAPYEFIKHGYKVYPNNEELALQHYNGMGTIEESSYPQERKMLGIKGKVKGSEVPLYGKRVISIRENIVKKNPTLMKLIDEAKNEAEGAGRER